MKTTIDRTKFQNESRKHRVLPPNIVIKHVFQGGRVAWTSGNEHIKVGIEFNKQEPIDIIEFDMDDADILEFMKKPNDQKPATRLIKARIKGGRDRLTLNQ